MGSPKHVADEKAVESKQKHKQFPTPETKLPLLLASVNIY